MIAMRCVLWLLSVSTLLLLAGCPVPPTRPGQPDATPPGWVQVQVLLEAPSATPVTRAEFDITYRDIVRHGVGPDLRLRLRASAGDSDSGIRDIRIESDITWKCDRGPLDGPTTNAPIDFGTLAQPSQATSIFAIDVTADPVAQTGCARGVGLGPKLMRGHVRAVATNGAGLTVRSQTLVFEFDDAVGLATGTAIRTGQMARGTDTLYMAECRKQGVPVPPDWHPSTRAWTLHGDLSTGQQNLLQPGSGAEVWTYSDPQVRGACIALPRTTGGARGGLAGIICQGATTGRACFWDSRRRDDADPLSEQPPINWQRDGLSIAELKDATNLTERGSGVCTDCHSGTNAFLISPDAAAWRSAIRTGGVGPTFTTELENEADPRTGRPRYTAVTGINGAVRGGWTNDFVPGGCGGACHEITRPERDAQAGRPPEYRIPAMPPQCAAGGPTARACYR